MIPKIHKTTLVIGTPVRVKFPRPLPECLLVSSKAAVSFELSSASVGPYANELSSRERVKLSGSVTVCFEINLSFQD